MTGSVVVADAGPLIALALMIGYLRSGPGGGLAQHHRAGFVALRLRAAGKNVLLIIDDHSCRV
jgi:hypothetical protein